MDDLHTASSLSRVVLGITLCVAACGPSDRPAPSRSLDDADELAARAAAEIEARRHADDCTPGASRVCHVYFTDSEGQKHCPLSTQVCRPEGHGWFPCGMYQLDDAGVPRLNDLESSKPEAAAGPED